jgi:cell wall assembly regulator SMI1
MQKFTRALTREVEVGGERLALTFDATGLSVRLVGSRRKPHALSWATIACAAAGNPSAGPEPTPEEIADALAALRAGAAKKTAAKATAPPVARAAMMSPAEKAPPPAPVRLADVLPRLDAWLVRHRPSYHAALHPGATPKQLEALQSALGQPLPEELRAWLGWHNGQKEGFHGAFVEAFYLLGTEGIASTARACREEDMVAGWNNAWIPLLTSDQGDLIALDPAAPGRPLREVWQGNDAHDVMAKSLADWAETLLKDFEANRYVEDPERGEVLRVSDKV